MLLAARTTPEPRKACFRGSAVYALGTEVQALPVQEEDLALLLNAFSLAQPPHRVRHGLCSSAA